MSLASLAADVLLTVGALLLIYDLSEYVAEIITEDYFKTVYDDVMFLAHFSLIISSNLFDPPSLSKYAQVADAPLTGLSWILGGLLLYATGVAMCAFLRILLYRAGVRTKQNELDNQSLRIDGDANGDIRT